MVSDPSSSLAGSGPNRRGHVALTVACSARSPTLRWRSDRLPSRSERLAAGEGERAPRVQGGEEQLPLRQGRQVLRRAGERARWSPHLRRHRQEAQEGGRNEGVREGFFSFGDDLWETINLRNDVQHFQDGLFVASIPTFNQAAVREALLNAVTHRDYRLGVSVFVRQYARRLEIVSPGGFLPGINPENVLWRQAPRNRRIAEAFQRCGLVERSGQGVDRMFEASIKEGKPRPDFSGTDDYQVSVTLRGEVQDPAFLRFLERVGEERTASFTTSDLLVLDLIRREEAVPEPLRGRLPSLVDDGVVERMGKGRATTYILSRALHGYGLMRAKGKYTRKRGLDRETQKELLLKHVRDCADQGAPLSELAQVLPEMPIGRVQGLMRELKAEGKVVPVGKTRASRWHLPPSP